MTRPAGIDFECDVDCDGGGVNVNLANNDNSVIVKLDQHPHLERQRCPTRRPRAHCRPAPTTRCSGSTAPASNECTSLVADRKELAAMRHK